MSKTLKVGILAFHGDVSEHVWATETAAANLKLSVKVSLVRTKAAAEHLDALIIPGGESTTLYKLIDREIMVDTIKHTPAIMGTCAGAILLAKRLTNPASGQKTLGLMDITITRNAYGRQDQSFETTLKTPFGTFPTAFIRAPRIDNIGQNVNTIAEFIDHSIVCEQFVNNLYYLALTCHPELTTSKFHEHFLTQLSLRLR